jgi:hypothetical protein
MLHFIVSSQGKIGKGQENRKGYRTHRIGIDPFRRSHATQYFSYPQFKFDRLRKEFPDQYESGADIELNEWILMRIEVNDDKARLFLNEGEQPVLSVDDLKHGPDSSGGIGLWVDVGTEGFFAGLTLVNG